MSKSVLHQKFDAYFSKQLIDLLAKQSGEDSAKIANAIQSAVTLTAYQYIQKIALKEPSKALYILSRVAFGAQIKNSLMHMFRGSSHFRGLLNMSTVLFGENLKAVKQWLSKESGLREDYSDATLNMVVPVVLSVFGDMIKSNRLSQVEYVSYMTRYKETVIDMSQNIPLFPFYLFEQGLSNKARSAEKSNAISFSTTRENLLPENLSLRMMKWSLTLILGALAFVYKIIQ
jgi:hypothetical protein